MLPRRADIIGRRTDCVPKKTALAFTAIRVSQCSSVTSQGSAERWIPALLTSTSTRPKRASVRSDHRVQVRPPADVGRDASASRPRISTSRAVRSPAADVDLGHHDASAHPGQLQRHRAADALPPPVTIATCSSSSIAASQCRNA